MAKKLRVYGLPWHVAHQYELAKLPFVSEYGLQINPYRVWGDTSRPMPANMHYVDKYEKGKYDFAILHVDQQSIYDPEAGDRIHKGRLYAEMREAIGDDIPIITINHMTPFHDKYDSSYVVDKIKKLTDGTTVIVNSHEAQRQWGFGRPIIHGLDQKEWYDLPKEPRIVTVLSQGGMEKAYRRVFLTTVIRILREMGVPFKWVGVDIRPQSFDEYREYLGRSLVFFFPAWQSPMPRARTEAMLSGCCVVTTPYQDASTFIDHGVNGFLTSTLDDGHYDMIDNPESTAELLRSLVLDKPKEAIRIGANGKKTAIDLFNEKGFHAQWKQLLTELNIL